MNQSNASDRIIETRSSISEIELRAALRALHHVIVEARWLAYQQEAHAKIATILDSAEIMPLLLSGKAVDGLGFADMLRDLARTFPRLQWAWQKYRDETSGSSTNDGSV